MRKRHQETFQIPGTELAALVKRSKNRKSTVAISISPSGTILVAAPTTTALETLEAISQDRVEWILKSLTEVNKLNQYCFPKAFISGESVHFLGKQYIIKRVETDGFEQNCTLKGQYIVVPIPKGLDKTLEQEVAKEHLISWYKQQATLKLPERVKKYAKKYGFEYKSILIREQEKRWGSCDYQGNLRFNFKIIMAPPSLIDYVIAHELCHLKVKNHTQEFWSLLESIMHDYENRKRKLKELGATYTL